MTRDQWKLWEDSMKLAPEILREMYQPGHMEVTQDESLDLARAVRAGTAALTVATEPGMIDKVSDEELRVLVDASVSLIAGLYGRLMGLAKAYDEAITKQAVLEAELATTGK